MKTNRPKYYQIINAAVNVFAENGFHGSKVSKIAKAAGVADGTIYLYFKSKEDILTTMFKEKMGEFIEKIVNKIGEKKTAEEKLYTLIHMHFNQLSKNKQLAIVTQLELRQSDYELRMELNQILKPYLLLIDDIVKEGMLENTFRSDLKVPLVRQMIFGTLDEIVTNWVMKDCRYRLLDEVEQVHRLFVDGLCRIKK